LAEACEIVLIGTAEAEAAFQQHFGRKKRG